MSVLYIPFSDNEGNADLRRLARRWVDAVAADTRWKNPPEIKIHGSMPDVLQDVQSTETVYVLGHGGVHNDLVANDQNGSLLMRYDVLAHRLLADRLTLRHRAIKLYFCNPFGGPIRQFAEQFKHEMWQLNYTGALDVYYYNGSVSVPLPEEGGEYHKHSTQGALRVTAGGHIYPARASNRRMRV
jgi:hypothetical protein